MIPGGYCLAWDNAGINVATINDKCGLVAESDRLIEG